MFTALMALIMGPAALAQQYDNGPELEPDKDYFAILYTTKGEVPVRLYNEKTPITVRNFVNLAEGTAEYKDPETGEKVKKPFYNGVLFHRVIPSFMIQTGDPTGTGQSGPGYKIPGEIREELRFDRPGLLGAAKKGNDPEMSGSQFFITEVPTPHLNDRHTIFGEVMPGSNGLLVVKEIARVDRNSADKPRDPVLLERIDVIRLEKGLSPQAAFQKMQEEKMKRLAPDEKDQGAAE